MITSIKVILPNQPYWGTNEIALRLRGHHQEVSKQAISNWIKLVLKKYGVNTQTFTTHSTRSASVSAAKFGKVPIQMILKTARWKSECTFRKFWNKPCNKDNVNMGNVIIKKFSILSIANIPLLKK